MAVYDGNDGVVKVATNVVAEVANFSITETVNMIEKTSMGAAARSYGAGIPSWKGSMTCRWDKSDTTGQGAMTIGAELAGLFYPSGAVSTDEEMSGTIIIEEVGVNVDKEDYVERSFSFQGTGALTHGTVV